MTNLPALWAGETLGPCTVCAAPESPLLEAVGRSGVLFLDFGCPVHADGVREAAAAERRRETYAAVAARSCELTMTPEEYVGRYGHGWVSLTGPEIAADDPDAPPGLAAWSARMFELMGDLERRRELQIQYLSAEELAAIDARDGTDDGIVYD